MKISKLVVLCVAAGMGATLTANSQQVVVSPTPGGGQAGLGVVRRPFEAKVLKGQPYSAETVNESVQTLGDGNKIVRRTTGRVYRDVEGRVRREDDRPSGSPGISISDPVANVSWTLNTDNKTAREIPAMPRFEIAGMLENFNLVKASTPTVAAGGVGQAAGGGGGRGGRGAAGGGVGVGSVTPSPTAAGQMVARGGGGGGRGGAVGGRNMVEESLPNKSIENLLCSGIRRTTTIEKGTIGNEQPIKIVSEEWTSIDLQVLVLTDLNDPRSGRTTYKLQNVRRADPDLSLFKVPSDYTITKMGGGRGRGGN